MDDLQDNALYGSDDDIQRDPVDHVDEVDVCEKLDLGMPAANAPKKQFKFMANKSQAQAGDINK